MRSLSNIKVPIILAIYSTMFLINPTTAYAIDSSLPTDAIYTEQGFIWYSQSGNQHESMQGYWDGYNKSYHGRVTMHNPTFSACGPISLAIILSNVKQQVITPKETIQWSCDTGYYTGSGSSHSIGERGAEEYGVSSEECLNIPHRDRMEDMDVEVAWMRSHLEKGHWIQILVKNQPNISNTIWGYPGGHFVAIRGYNNGSTFVYDSVGKDKVEAEYPLEEVWKNIRNPFADGCGSLHMIAIW